MESWICSFDWPKSVGVFKDLVLSGAAVVTSVAAVRGISKWRAEEQGKADFDLARRALTLIFTFRSEFQRARAAFVGGGEFPPGLTGFEKDRDKSAQAWAHVFDRRLIDLQARALALEALRGEMEGLWGEPYTGLTTKLLAHFMTLRSAMNAYVENELSGGEDFKSDKEFAIEMRRVVFAMVIGAGEKASDDLGIQVAADVKALAAALRARLPRPLKG